MKPLTVEEYLEGLPSDRRAQITRVQHVVDRSMPTGYERMMCFGMIAWSIPLSRLPDTYNGQPLNYVALGTHKNFNTLYLMGVYGSAEQRAALEQAFKATGKRMDMGKSCLHFKSAADLPLDTIGKLIAAIPSEKWIAIYRDSRAKQATRKALKPKAATRTRKVKA